MSASLRPSKSFIPLSNLPACEVISNRFRRGSSVRAGRRREKEQHRRRLQTELSPQKTSVNPSSHHTQGSGPGPILQSKQTYTHKDIPAIPKIQRAKHHARLALAVAARPAARQQLPLGLELAAQLAPVPRVHRRQQHRHAVVARRRRQFPVRSLAELHGAGRDRFAVVELEALFGGFLAGAQGAARGCEERRCEKVEEPHLGRSCGGWCCGGGLCVVLERVFAARRTNCSLTDHQLGGDGGLVRR